MINKSRLVKLTQQLIRINSENPGSDEAQIACFVKRYLEKIGLKTKIYEFKRRRSNVVGHLKGRNDKVSLLLSPHLDTVPAGSNWRLNPFAATIQGGKIYGRGATDDKGNLAGALEAINSIVEDKIKLNYSLLFAATADEEGGSQFGIIPLINKSILKPDYALILDAADFNIVVTQKGLLHCRIKVPGKKAHGAYPERGINAIERAIHIIDDIKKHKFKYRRQPYLGSPTINLGTIQGGDRVNIVPDWCEFQLDIRFLPGMSSKAILGEIKKIARDHTAKFKLEVEAVQKPYSIDEKHFLVLNLTKALKKTSREPIISGSQGATVMTLFADKKIPAVAFGFGSSGQSHVSNEYVKIDNLYKGARILEIFLKDFNL
jgi:succinyl-diaminopimelate desuccinylase